MEHTRTGGRLYVRLERDFNLLTARRIERLARDADAVVLDLSATRLVDTEALALIDRLRRGGAAVRLRHPPPIFYEILRLLDLEGHFDPATLVEA